MNLNFIRHSWPLTVIQLTSSVLIVMGLMTYNLGENTVAILMMISGVLIWIISLFIEKNEKKQEIENL